MLPSIMVFFLVENSSVKLFWRLPAKQEAALNVVISFLFFRGHETSF